MLRKTFGSRCRNGLDAVEREESTVLSERLRYWRVDVRHALQGEGGGVTRQGLRGVSVEAPHRVKPKKAAMGGQGIRY